MSRFARAGLMVVVLFSGCGLPEAQTYDRAGSPALRGGVMAAAAAYEERPVLTTSLFKSDQAVMDDEAIRRILSSELAMVKNAKIALMKFPGSDHAALRYYGHQYWRSEDYLKTQQKYIDTISRKLSASDRVADVILLPSLLTPTEATIPHLREAAVRLRADLLLVFRLTSDIYY